MWQFVCMLAALLCLGPSQAEEITLKKVGDDVILSPGQGSGSITSIIWRDGQNIAVQWDKSDSEITYYRDFKNRGNLTLISGVMTIRGLTRSDSKVYTSEINGTPSSSIRLVVMAPVPVPVVTASCNAERTSCNLTCEADVTGVENVTYKWKSDSVQLTSSFKDLRIDKEDSQSVQEFSCQLHNPVSDESSGRIANPFTTKPTSERKLNVNTGVAVFSCLLGAVLLLAFVHRWRAGMWFFQKASMPWEADFWRKQEKPSGDAAGSKESAACGEDHEQTPIN